MSQTINQLHGDVIMSNQKMKIICIINGSEVRYIDEKTKTVILIQHLIDGKLKGEVSVAHSKDPIDVHLPAICRKNNSNDLFTVSFFYQYPFVVDLKGTKYSAAKEPILDEYVVNLSNVQESIELTLWVVQ